MVRAPARDPDRGDRHQRQDLGGHLHPPDLAAHGVRGREYRHDRRGRQLFRPVAAYYARADHLASLALGYGGRRRDPCRDGGLVPRAGAAPAGWRDALGGRVYEFHARSPRLSCELRGVFCRQGRALHPRSARRRGGGDQSRRSQGRGTGALHHRARSGTDRDRPYRAMRDADPRPAVRCDRAGCALLVGRLDADDPPAADRRVPGDERAHGGGARHCLWCGPRGRLRDAAEALHRARADATGRHPRQWRDGFCRLRPYARRGADRAQGAAPACDGPPDRHRRRGRGS